jgi:cytosine/uracil/thiamine/allantoin permease
MATVGVDYGIPGQVATRAIYGLRGSKVIPSFLRSIASCYWFAFQTVIGATAICAVLEKLTGTSFSLILVSVLFGIVQAVVAIAFTGIGYTLTAMAVAGRSKIMALARAPSNALPVPAE